MSDDFNAMLGSMREANSLLTPVNLNRPEQEPKKIVDDKVTIDVVNGNLMVRMSRALQTHERRYLKDNGFHSEDDDRLWAKPDDGSMGLVKLAFSVPDDLQIRNQMDIEAMKEAFEKAMTKGSANEVFAEFSKMAAAMKVSEMVGALESSDRQRAQETVLGYALGKPVERTISLHANIANMSKEELVDKIREKLASLGSQLGIEGTTRGSALLIDDNGGGQRDEPLEGVCTESGVSGEVPSEPNKD